MKEYVDFLQNEVPEKLESLSANSKAQWGTMKAEEMLEHLRVALVLSVENVEDEIIVPNDKLEMYKRFLISDKPFGKDLPKPGSFDKIEAQPGALNEKKEQLLAAVHSTILYFNQNPNHKAIHPSFGKLNVAEWLHLHRKHFTHHLTQFGLY